MSRLIDADALRAEFTSNLNELWHFTGIWAMIDVAPTVDAVEVVRCKDCIYGRRDSDIPCYPYRCAYIGFGYKNNPKHFCAYGKREADK